MTDLDNESSLNGNEQFLKKLRESKGWTRQQAADHLDVSASTYANWENGIKYPSITNAIKLGNAFNESPLSFLTVNRAMHHLNDFNDEKSVRIRNKLAHQENNFMNVLQQQMVGLNGSFDVSLSFNNSRQAELIKALGKMFNDKSIGSNPILKPYLFMFFDDLLNYLSLSETVDLKVRGNALKKQIDNLTQLIPTAKSDQ